MMRNVLHIIYGSKFRNKRKRKLGAMYLSLLYVRYIGDTIFGSVNHIIQYEQNHTVLKEHRGSYQITSMRITARVFSVKFLNSLIRVLIREWKPYQFVQKLGRLPRPAITMPSSNRVTVRHVPTLIRP